MFFFFLDKTREEDAREELHDGTTKEAEMGDAEDTDEVCGLSHRVMYTGCSTDFLYVPSSQCVSL